MATGQNKLLTGKQGGNRAIALAESRRREAEAVRLRGEGKPLAEIAAQLGYESNGEPDPAGAYKAWKRGISRIPAQAIEDMRRDIWAQQQTMIAALMPRVIQAGDTFAAKEITAIHDRMAKLFGLDKAPDALGPMLTGKRIIIVEAGDAPLPPLIAARGMGAIVDADDPIGEEDE